jgi:hypothetical protein
VNLPPLAKDPSSVPSGVNAATAIFATPPASVVPVTMIWPVACTATQSASSSPPKSVVATPALPNVSSSDPLPLGSRRATAKFCPGPALRAATSTFPSRCTATPCVRSSCPRSLRLARRSETTTPFVPKVATGAPAASRRTMATLPSLLPAATTPPSASTATPPSMPPAAPGRSVRMPPLPNDASSEPLSK